MKKLRLLKSSLVISGFIALFCFKLISMDIVNFPYFDLTVLLPNTMPPFPYNFWQENIKGFIFINISIFLSYFVPSFFIITSILFYFSDKNNEKIQRGQARVSAKNLRKIIKKEIKNRYRLELFNEKIPLPFLEENRGILFLGKAGAGKTQAIYNFMLENKGKCQVQSKSTPIRSAKVHHFVTPI